MIIQRQSNPELSFFSWRRGPADFVGDIFLVSCRMRRAASCPARLHLVGWAATRGAAHVVCHGYPGSYPPQLVPEHLVPVVQRRLELVRAGANEAEQSNSWSDHRDELPNSCELSSSSYEPSLSTVNHRRAMYPK